MSRPRTALYAEAIRACHAEGLTVNQTADRVGLNRKTVLKYGTELGLTFLNGHTARVPCPVEIRGVVYASADEAARLLKVDRRTIYSALCRGKMETVGMGRGHRAPEKQLGGRRTPMVIGGLRFATKKDAAAFFGYSARAFYSALRRKTGYDKIIRMALAHTANAEQDAYRKHYGRGA